MAALTAGGQAQAVPLLFSALKKHQRSFRESLALQARFSFVYYIHLIHRFPRENGYEGAGSPFINICCPVWPRSTIPFGL